MESGGGDLTSVVLEQSPSPKSNPTAVNSSNTDTLMSQTSAPFSTSHAIQFYAQQVFSRLSLLGDFLASRPVPPESAKDSPTNAGSLESAYVCFGKCVQQSPSLKMSVVFSQLTMDLGLPPSKLDWPRSGMLVSGRFYRLRTLAPLTSENGSGSSALTNWPSARKEDGESCGNHPGAVDSLTGAMKAQWAWPTPTKQDGENNGAPSQFDRNSLPLNAAVKNWPTHTNSTMTPQDQVQAMFAGNSKNRPKYQDAVMDLSGPPPKDSGQADREKPSMPGNPQEQLWATPRSGKVTDENQEAWQKRKDAGADCTPPLTLQAKQGGAGKLNPTWTESLMGLPLNWTQIPRKFKNPTARTGSKR